MITGENLVGSKETQGKGTTFPSLNPTTGEEATNIFYAASIEDVNEAASLAAAAFTQFRSTSGSVRATFLRDIADSILEFGDTLIDTAVEETGLPQARLIGERGRTVNQLKMFADLIEEGSWVEASIDTAIPEREPVPKPDLRRMMIPVGPVVVFGASNFPLAFSTAGGDTASALAAGNPVIVKSHRSHPGTSELVARAIRSAVQNNGLHEGVFSHLHDDGFDIGEALVLHPFVKSVAFTGSFTGGKALYDIAQQREEPIPVFAEMGSINPVLLFPDALTTQKEQIASAYAGSITLGVGQFCTNPGLILGVTSSELTDFSDTLTGEISGSGSATMLNSGIAQNYSKLSDEAISQQGVSLLGRGESNQMVNEGVPAVAAVDGADFLSNPKLSEEVFGPFSLIVSCRNDEELRSVIAGLAGQLTITLMCTEKDLEDHQGLIEEVKEKAGRIIFNGVPTGVEVCPSMQHGGPYPSTTDSRFTSVGTAAIKRFVRPVTYQDCPDKYLPPELQDANPLGIWRTVNGSLTRE